MSDSVSAPPAQVPSAQSTGIVILLGSVLAIAFMAHHPHGHSHAELPDFVSDLTEGAWLNRMVHGSLILIMVLLYYGFSCFASRLGSHRPTVRLGLLAYTVGVLMMCVAALLSGFVVPKLAFAIQKLPPEQWESMRAGFLVCYAGNQVCAQVGVISWALSLLFWSGSLVRKGVGARVVAIIGGTIGAGLMVALAVGHLQTDIHGMMALVLAQSAWSISIAVLLIRRQI